MKRHISLIVLLISLQISPLNAAVYKWTDKDGNIHFGDQPTDQASATEIQINTNNKSGITNSSGNKEERDYLLKKIEKDKLADAEKRKKKSAENKKRQQRCNYYKSRYQSHIQSNRTFTTSPDGERRYYTDKERTARKRKLSKGVARYCR